MSGGRWFNKRRRRREEGTVLLRNFLFERA
jgi:hypothetical protein